MHVALICPFTVGPIRGNITTVRRISHFLAEAGCRVTLLPLDSLTPAEQHDLLKRNRPDLLHAFHAYHSGPTAQHLAQVSGVPYLVTITGSDLFDPAMSNDKATRQAIAAAAAVTCFDSLVATCLKEVFPEAANKVTVIPQGVAPLPVAETFFRPADEFLILLPAALRPVKGIANALDALLPLSKEFPSLRLVLAGGDLDPNYTGVIRERVTMLPWVHLLGEVPWQRMGPLYTTADLMNCSLFEGGMANTLLEAMSMGRPILARDVPGNRSLIRHGKTGWLFENDDDLRQLVRLVLRSPELGSRIGEAGRDFVRKRCSPSIEARRYVRIYERVIRENLWITEQI